ncbi:hypothetical protein EB796_006486 [Bugula neritina]|uniref:DCXR n=1 Tax=Bugula neritina TaxID=10212 RepID=A0A7J7KAK3_BUGNE|nr:hypothetical protein EB796_006486 [Bugula neritina]
MQYITEYINLAYGMSKAALDQFTRSLALDLAPKQVRVNGCPTAVAYSMSKAAIDHFARSLALELAPKQVRVNTVNPGVVATNIYNEIMPKDKIPALIKDLADVYPIGRIGQPEEIAKSIAFLASSEASFTTGVQLVLDGGFHLSTPELPM